MDAKIIKNNWSAIKYKYIEYIKVYGMNFNMSKTVIIVLMTTWKRIIELESASELLCTQISTHLYQAKYIKLMNKYHWCRAITWSDVKNCIEASHHMYGGNCYRHHFISLLMVMNLLGVLTSRMVASRIWTLWKYIWTISYTYTHRILVWAYATFVKQFLYFVFFLEICVEWLYI